MLNAIIVTYVSVVREFCLSRIWLVTDEFIGGCQTFLLRVTRPLRVGSGDETTHTLRCMLHAIVLLRPQNLSYLLEGL